jgi:hypothetical protein
MKKTLLLFSLLAWQFQSEAQITGLLASYYFNNGNANDDIGPYNGTVVGATLTNDRFGNPNHAYYFWGNPHSYINLTTSPVLKNTVQSISMWVKVDSSILAGSGYTYNPILLTKCQQGNNFYEAYAVYFDYTNNKFITVETQPFANQQYFFSSPISFHHWYHVVLAYDNNTIWLYVNATLQQTMNKGYTSVFLQTDSVMLGNSANVQNNRFFYGAIDDIGYYDYVLSIREVAVLYEEGNPTTGIAGAQNPATTIYPNPAHDWVTIPGAEKYSIRNLLSEEVANGKSTGDRIDLSEIPQGVYFVEISDNLGKTSTHKIIKE